MSTGHTKKESQRRIKAAEAALRDVLDRMYPKGKGLKLADELLIKYGSPGAVIEAGKHQLMKEGLSESNALLISLVPDLVRHIERNKYGKHPQLRTLIATEKFLERRFIGENIERFYLLALDNSGKLIECVHLQSGTEDSAPFYLKHVLSDVVRTGAKSVVLTHNHPNSTPKPSEADIDCTLALMDALQVIGVPLLDHIVMLGSHAVSIRGFGYVAEGEWITQVDDHPLLRGWLKGWDIDAALESIQHLARKGL
ncbi:MAG: hypothetical protein IJC56_05075 [Clostridia bacterium]|nr:hypothetical protein [Clostridia bacterium]